MHRTAGLLFAGILLLLVPHPGLATTPIVLANPGFESGVSPWQICGGATHVDAQVAGANAVHSGRYAIQLQNPSTTVGCPSPPPGYEYMGLTPQALWQEVTIPADTPAVTVSFWYWVDGLPRTDLDVYLASNMYKFSAGFGGEDLGRVSPYLLPGWQLFRRVLTPNELAQVRGKTLWLAFRLYDPLGADDTLTFRIDDVQVVGADVRTTAAPLPAALRGDGSQPLAFIREDTANSYRTRLYRMDTDGRRFATIRPTGSYRYDADGNASRNQALMRFARQNLASPRMLLLADHGGIRHPAWSPDGTYLIYTLIHASATDIWWLDVATGATGPITIDGLSSDANWRPACPGLAGVRRNSACAGVGQRSYIPLVQR